MPKTITCPHEGCKYLFAKPVHLRRHLLSHSNAAVWRCPECDQEFKRIDSFQRHKKRMHEDLPDLKAVKIDAANNFDRGVDDEDDGDEDDGDENNTATPSPNKNKAEFSPDNLHGGTPTRLTKPSPQYEDMSISPSSVKTSTPSSTTPYTPSLSARTASSNSPLHQRNGRSLSRPQPYHPYARPEPAPVAPQISPSAWQPTHSYEEAAPPLSSGPMYPNMFPNAMSSNAYNAQNAYADTPLSIASLTAPSPSWNSSTSAPTSTSDDGQNFFDDILQSILMDSISSFVPHETMAPLDLPGLNNDLSVNAFPFSEQQASQDDSHQYNQHHPQHQQHMAWQQQQQTQLHPVQNQHHFSHMPSQAQQQHPMLPQMLAQPVPFATFTESAHTSGRSTPGTPRHPGGGIGVEDVDEMSRSVEKVGDQAATNIGARTRDLVLHGVNIPKKPPRLTAASLFNSASRHIRAMLPIIPSYWLMDHRRLATERPYVFICLLQLGTLWQPRADVKAYGQELWHLIFRSIWAGAVFYLDQPQQMREATAVMALLTLYAFMCRDENIRRKSIHSTYTGSSLAHEYAWRQGVWFLHGAWEDSLQRLLGPTIQLALIELEVLDRDAGAHKLSHQQKGLIDQLKATWKQWFDAEEVNRIIIGHGFTESHHSEFLTDYHQMRSMYVIICQALIPCADDIWDAPSAIEWAKLVLEYKAARERRDQPLASGKRQLGPLLDELLIEGASSGEKKAEWKRILSRFSIKEHFILASILEGLHLLWISRHTPPFRRGSSYALDFAPTATAMPTASSTWQHESTQVFKRKAFQSKPFKLTQEMMLSALSKWMKMFEDSFAPPNSNPFSSGIGIGSRSTGPERHNKTPSLGPSNDRFHLHFRWHVVQLSTLFNAHHVIQALWSTGEMGQSGGGPSSSTNIELLCESCVNSDTCPYFDSRKQRWAALHAGAVIGCFMSMPRLSTLTPMILEGLGHAYGILVILCKLNKPRESRQQCACSPHVRDAPLELVTDQCMHLDAARPSPSAYAPNSAHHPFEANHLCWLHHGTVEDGALLLGQAIQEWPIVLQDMGNELKSVAGTWQIADEFLKMATRTLNSFTFYVDRESAHA